MLDDTGSVWSGVKCRGWARSSIGWCGTALVLVGGAGLCAVVLDSAVLLSGGCVTGQVRDSIE